MPLLFADLSIYLRAVMYTAKACKQVYMPYAVVKVYMSTWFVLDGASHTSTSEPQDRSWLVEFPKNIWMFPAMNGCDFSVSTPTCRSLCFLFPTSTSVRSRNSMSVVLLIETLSTSRCVLYFLWSARTYTEWAVWFAWVRGFRRISETCGPHIDPAAPADWIFHEAYGPFCRV